MAKRCCCCPEINWRSGYYTVKCLDRETGELLWWSSAGEDSGSGGDTESAILLDGDHLIHAARSLSGGRGLKKIDVSTGTAVSFLATPALTEAECILSGDDYYFVRYNSKTAGNRFLVVDKADFTEHADFSALYDSSSSNHKKYRVNAATWGNKIVTSDTSSVRVYSDTGTLQSTISSVSDWDVVGVTMCPTSSGTVGVSGTKGSNVKVGILNLSTETLDSEDDIDGTAAGTLPRINASGDYIAVNDGDYSVRQIAGIDTVQWTSSLVFPSYATQIRCRENGEEIAVGSSSFIGVYDTTGWKWAITSSGSRSWNWNGNDHGELQFDSDGNVYSTYVNADGEYVTGKFAASDGSELWSHTWEPDSLGTFLNRNTWQTEVDGDHVYVSGEKVKSF